MKQLIIFIILLLVMTGLNAQSSNIPKSKVVIETKDRNEHYGTLKEETETVIILQTSKGEKSIEKENILSIDELNYNGKHDYPNPHYASYFREEIGTGIPLRKGRSYLRSSLFGVSTFVYGVTDNFSIGGGTIPVAFILKTPNISVTPKFAYSFNRLIHVGVGATYSYSYTQGLLGFDVSSHGHLVSTYTAFTVGNSESNLSVGLGYSYISSSSDSTNDNVEGLNFSNNSFSMSCSGSIRLARRISLMSENYIRTKSNSHYMDDDKRNLIYDWAHGFRFHTERNVFDLAIRPNDGWLPIIPSIGYIRIFGKS